jgi:hypothetical protein
MLPADLRREHFSRYPEQARTLCVENLHLLQQLPMSFLPSLLRQIIEYDYGFPAERAEINQQLTVLRTLSPVEMRGWFRPFAEIEIAEAKTQQDWVNQPAHFLEDISAYLWSTHQMDRFHRAADEYGNRMQKASGPPPAPHLARLGIAIIGQGVAEYQGTLFGKLRPHGTLFTAVKPANGLQQTLDLLATRTDEAPEPYTHWYVDGGPPAVHASSLVSLSYAELAPARQTLLRYIGQQTSQAGMGPEQLRSNLMRLAPRDLGMHGDAVLDRFQIKLLTEGSGTQIFSTTFAQWASREVLRRAQAVSLLVRYAPRQRQRPMNVLLSADSGDNATDPTGSLIDADMGAYYQWIDQQRLPGADRSAFVAWFEGHNQAIVISPAMPRGAESRSPVDMKALLRLSLG